MSNKTIEVSVYSLIGIPAVSIGYSNGHSYRILGPKIGPGMRLISKNKITKRDADNIRQLLDDAYPSASTANGKEVDELIKRWNAIECKCDLSVGHVCEVCHDLDIIKSMKNEIEKLRNKLS